jgi:hypothetical protein
MSFSWSLGVTGKVTWSLSIGHTPDAVFSVLHPKWTKIGYGPYHETFEVVPEFNNYSVSIFMRERGFNSDPVQSFPKTDKWIRPASKKEDL